MSNFTKWVACWGNATSITDRTVCSYAKDITLRYPIKMCFDGDKIRIRFSNLTGTEPVRLRANIAKALSDRDVDELSSVQLYKDGSEEILIPAGRESETDPCDFRVNRGDIISVSIYLPDITQMNAGVLISGPLSKGFYSFGDHAFERELPEDLTRRTNWFYFLNTIDVLTEEKNRALICYGDSITAQDWPDYLIDRTFDEGYEDISVIRRAVSGTRILRQYDCITYAAYGLKGETRFPIEMNVAGATDVIIQHGINDIIHPVGVEVNPFRPWEDLPTVEELKKGVEDFYLKYAEQTGLRVYSGTLLPIYGWRTYADFREELRQGFNNWLRTSSKFYGCIDFDEAVRDGAQPVKFREGFDSGDHLHPSKAAYKEMAYTVPESLLMGKLTE